MTRRPTLLPWLVLLAVPWTTAPLAAQSVPFLRLQRTAPYDVAQGRFLSSDDPALALGVGETLVYDNVDETGSYEPNEAGEIFMDWGRLTGFGENAITRMVICYGTTNTGNVTVTVRLHQGLEDQDDPGAGLALDLDGLPGSLDGSPIAWQVPLLFSEPLYLRDGPLRYSLQGTDGLTGPALVNRNEALEISDTLQFFSAEGVADGTQDLGSGGDPASVFTELWALPHGDDDLAPVQASLTGRDQVTGVLPAGGSHVFRLDSLPGELLTVQVRAGKGSEVLPQLTVSEVVADLPLASVGDGTNKAGIKKLALPGGAVALTLTSSGGGGSYRMKLTAKPAKTSLKPPVDGAGQSLGGLLASVEADAGTLLTARVAPLTKGLGTPPRPVLVSPLGEWGADDWVLKGKGTWTLNKVVLPLRGPYELRAGVAAEGDDAVDQPVGAKLALKPAKAKAAKRDLAEADLAGHWLRDGFLTEVARTTAWFRQGKGGAGQLVESQANPEDTPGQPALVQTSQLSRWDVEVLDGLPAGERRLTYRVQSVALQPPLFPIFATAGEVDWLYEHPGGDTDLLVRDGGGSLPEVWRRDRQDAPAAPALAELGLGDWPGEGPQPFVLAIEEQPGVVRYDVYKAGVTATVRPARPVASLPALPVPSSGEPFVTLFTDLSSLDGTPASYWVVAVDADGRRSPASLPVILF